MADVYIAKTDIEVSLLNLKRQLDLLEDEEMQIETKTKLKDSMRWPLHSRTV